ncbi:ferredoxin [Amycolatopsis sp. NPDC005232]|uniref:ferredoxin n=1 Tax=Amycolatopsis sp. NPDC005232 TaxID=3157027 RepID=UPI0033B08872
MTYVITVACVDIMDRSCMDECPVDCIHEGARMLYIKPDECIDCGACEPACPQNAIFRDDELPAGLESFRRVNADFFALDDLGPDVNGTGPVDHPSVAAHPSEG